MSSDHPPGLDLGRLRQRLDRDRPGLVSGPLTGRLIEGGRSNLTYAVSDGAAKWVVRRPPLGHVLATAHDMKREHRVISALYPTAVPVPRPVLLCEDEDVVGAPFYVMEFVDGTPYRTAEQLAPLGPDRTRAAVLGLVDTLVELHAVAPADVGLEDFGRPEGFLDRQLRRWGKQLDASRNRELAGIDELHAALGRELPTSPAPTVVHGDYRLDNVLIGAASEPKGRAGVERANARRPEGLSTIGLSTPAESAPEASEPIKGDDEIKAILDWEMSTLGDPLTDLGLLVMYSVPLQTPDSPVSTTATAAGHPDPAELIERYAARSGRDVSAVSWYTAFAWFKLAVILEGIHYRYTLGQTVGAGFDRIGDLVPVFIEHGLTTLQEG
ncbi:phosphotransferase family protein [Streptomyces himalayensis]|uniref:Phosphotransferase family protein n=1 Tax=Streptomyces himalayensis subsp. himalayensis TaxID=2756131 RepID=A0A7W0I8M4_9ACTN|nr:phosphotransferase family protein [Streptomyces himalayensis]MBA2946472.1 phosphotransferase family protein [Streptomyces himalayensis subsp. himalayensis]